MDAEAALIWVDSLVLTKTGERLSALQRTILQQVWQGRKYLEIAQYYGYTEGHSKILAPTYGNCSQKNWEKRLPKLAIAV